MRRTGGESQGFSLRAITRIFTYSIGADGLRAVHDYCTSFDLGVLSLLQLALRLSLGGTVIVGSGRHLSRSGRPLAFDETC